MTKQLLVLIISFSIANLAFANSDSTSVDTEAYQAIIDSIENTLNYQHGRVQLDGGIATINIPEGYKMLGPEQSNYVMADLWGNPPSEILGLLFPEEISPLSDNFTFAVEITYSEDGFIEDEDAEDIDYDDLLEEMQQDAKDANSERIQQGYPSIELIGWAAAPYYDKANKKLHWAKELKFGDDQTNTLNYNIRVLGRKGYLNMNAIGQIGVLPTFTKDINKILSSVEFNPGNKYADFNPSIDKVAAYGIGGLIAGKVLAKAGFFALILKFWKIIAVAIVAGFGLLRKKLFG